MMKHVSKSMLLMLFAVIVPTAQAAVKTFSFEDGKDKDSIKLQVPAKWQDARDLYGVPLFLLGPEKDGSRPTLAVTPTGIADLAFDEKGLDKTQDQYKKGREEWLKNNGGKSVSYLPYKTEKWGNVDVAHSIGFRYELDGQEYVEKSFYVFCKKKLYHMKSLMTSQQEKAHAKSMEETIRSFACLDGSPSELKAEKKGN